MKVISLLQPWATLVVIGAKKIETRSWNTRYTGDILIHASKKMTAEQKDLCEKEYFAEALKDVDELPLGFIIGKVNIVDTAPTGHYLSLFGDNPATGLAAQLNSKQEKAFGDYKTGRYGWLLSEPVQFNKIIPAKGSLSLWDFNEQICLKCGSRDNDACISKAFGPCWWVAPGLCSHCEEGVTDCK